MRRPIVFVCLSYIVCILLYINFAVAFFDISYDDSSEKIGSEVSIRGICRDVAYENKKTSFILCGNIVGSSKNIRVLVKDYRIIKDYRSLPGREVVAKGVLELPKANTNPRTFDYRDFLKSKKIGSIMSLKSIEYGQIKSGFESNISAYRFKLIDRFVKTLEEDQAAVIIAMLIGDKTYLDDDLYNRIQRGGIAHILAISGLHIGIVYKFVLLVFRNKRSLVNNVVILLFFVIYAAIANFSASIIRAVLMILIHIGSKILHRRYDLITSACLSAMIILTINPWQVVNVGFQMSFLAILVMGFTLNKLTYKEINYFLKDYIIPLFVIQILMMPYTIYIFNYISFSGYFSNIPCVFVAGLLIPIGVVAMIILLFFGTIPQFLIDIMGAMAEIIIKINDFFFMDGRLSFNVSGFGALLVLGFYTLLFILISEGSIILFLRREYRGIYRYISLWLVFMVISFGFTYEPFDRANLVFVDIGQGNAILFRGSSGKTLLIDGGGSHNYSVGDKVLKPYLLKNGIKKIDYAIATHLDTDHYKGITEISQQKMVKNFCTYEGNLGRMEKISKDVGLPRERIFLLEEGDEIRVDKNLRLRVLFPHCGPAKVKSDFRGIAKAKALGRNAGGAGFGSGDLSGDDENSRSLVMKVTLNGVTTLVMGDLDSAGEAKLGGDLRSDILVVGHHGSKYSTAEELLDRVRPRAAVIQVGAKNIYGHPAKCVIDKLEKQSIMIYRSDWHGAIGFLCKKNSMKALTYLKQGRGNLTGEAGRR